MECWCEVADVVVVDVVIVEEVASALPSNIVEVLSLRERRDDCHRFLRGYLRRDVGVTKPPLLLGGGVPITDMSWGHNTIVMQQLYTYYWRFRMPLINLTFTHASMPQMALPAHKIKAN